MKLILTGKEIFRKAADALHTSKEFPIRKGFTRCYNIGWNTSLSDLEMTVWYEPDEEPSKDSAKVPHMWMEEE